MDCRGLLMYSIPAVVVKPSQHTGVLKTSSPFQLYQAISRHPTAAHVLGQTSATEMELVIIAVQSL